VRARRLDQLMPRGGKCRYDPRQPQLIQPGPCAARDERFADRFAEWALGSLRAGAHAGYSVPAPHNLRGWGRVLLSGLHLRPGGSRLAATRLRARRRRAHRADGAGLGHVGTGRRETVAERDALVQRAIDRVALAALTDVQRRFERGAEARRRFERDGGRTGGLSASGRPAAAPTRAHHGNAPRGLREGLPRGCRGG
jgi:hypothetical protein